MHTLSSETVKYRAVPIPHRTEKPTTRDIILIGPDREAYSIGSASENIRTLLSNQHETAEGRRFRHLLDKVRSATLNQEINIQTEQGFKFEKFYFLVKGILVQDPSQNETSVMVIIESATLSFRPESQKSYYFTPREQAVLQQIKQGQTNKEIATKLKLGVNTVKGHLKRIMNKMDIHTRSGIVGKLLAA